MARKNKCTHLPCRTQLAFAHSNMPAVDVMLQSIFEFVRTFADITTERFGPIVPAVMFIQHFFRTISVTAALTSKNKSKALLN